MINLIVWHDDGCPLGGRETALLRPFGLAVRWSRLRAQLERLCPLFLRFCPRPEQALVEERGT